MAALTKQGALYSQGGNHLDDPIAPDGTPYPRTGPDSFDCSGLVWWAYAQAGISVGLTTYDQIADGAPIPCTLADLRGAASTCWALGDLIFLRYIGGQHVAIYVGAGLFMDCYNHAVGCILHDVAADSFYAAHFAAARRIVSGCEGLSFAPGAPQQPSMTPAIELIPDLIMPVVLLLPWQCGSCLPDALTPLRPLAEPAVSWYDLGSWVNWLAVQLWNRSALPIICWMLAIAQAMLNSLGLLINTAIIPALNWLIRLLVLLVLLLRESVLALFAALSDTRQQLWLLLAPLARLSDLPGLLALARDLVSLVLLVFAQLGALILGVAQAFGYVVALVYSLAAALVGAILAPTPPAPLAAINTFFLFVWFRDVFQALADSRLGWAWAAFVAIVYLRFAVWLLNEAGSLNS